MAEAIRRISVRRGFAPEDHALVAFGGAGGQHACAVAARLGIATVILPPEASLLSAVGLGAAVLERFAVRQVLAPLASCRDDLDSWTAALADEALAALAREGVGSGAATVRRRSAELRLAGQEATLEIDVAAAEGRWEAAFAQRYASLYGYPPPPRAIEVVALRVVASERAPTDDGAPVSPMTAAAPARGNQRVHLGGRWRAVPTFASRDLRPGHTLDGPALVLDPHTTLVLPPTWHARVVASGAIVATAAPIRSPAS